MLVDDVVDGARVELALVLVDDDVLLVELVAAGVVVAGADETIGVPVPLVPSADGSLPPQALRVAAVRPVRARDASTRRVEVVDILVLSVPNCVRRVDLGAALRWGSGVLELVQLGASLVDLLPRDLSPCPCLAEGFLCHRELAFGGLQD